MGCSRTSPTSLMWNWASERWKVNMPRRWRQTPARPAWRLHATRDRSRDRRQPPYTYTYTYTYTFNGLPEPGSRTHGVQHIDATCRFFGRYTGAVKRHDLPPDVREVILEMIDAFPLSAPPALTG